jgi:hypothetical protein
MARTNIFGPDKNADLDFVEVFGLFEGIGEYGKHFQ